MLLAATLGGLSLFLAQVAVADQRCQGDETTCAVAEPTALLQQPKRPARPASLVSAGAPSRPAAPAGAKTRAATAVVHMRPRKFDSMPKKPKHAETKELCREMLDILGSDPEVVDAKALWGFACNEKQRSYLQQFKRGCLYVPTNKHVQTFFNVVERSNPWGFLSMWEDSFVEGIHKCPTDDVVVRHTRGKSQVTPCQNASGFVATDGSCIQATEIGKTGDSKIRVFKLEGLMGMDATWVRLIEKAGDEAVGESAALVQEQKAEGSRRAGNVAAPARLQTGQAHSIGIKYVLCDAPGSSFVQSYVTDEMLATQTDALNRAYSGQDQCVGTMSYAAQQVDTGFRFHSLGAERITNSLCAWDCKDNDALLHTIAPREDGMVKVLVCDTSLLGFASFPGWGDQWRILVVNPGVLPGSYIQNYNHGDTLTHEMGHYLGLKHTFEGGCAIGDDAVDTAAEAFPFYGCPTTIPRTTCSGGLADPVHNFMDYADDQCMCSFTQGQVQDIWNDLSLYQSDLLPPPR